MNLHRSLSAPISEALQSHAVLLFGPRQVGKTTLAKSFLGKKGLYLNYDNLDDRKQIRRFSFPKEVPLIVFDEIHKLKTWRTVIKGTFDTYFPSTKIFVTGSANLHHYSKGGDSLLGRTRSFRMHPFSLGEVSSRLTRGTLETLLKFGGFPQPFTQQSERSQRIWMRDRHARLIHDDLKALEHVQEISQIELLLDLLPERVGSPLSLNSLKEDLQVAHQTVDRWIKIFEALYLVYRISPYGPPRVKAVKKEQKLYFWDWATIQNSGARWENFVASQLLKYCHTEEDMEGHKMELRFLRNAENKEVDFVVLKNKSPIFAVECKTGEKNLSRSLVYFQNRVLSIPRWYQVHQGVADFGNESKGGRVLPFSKFCELEKIP